MIAMSVERRTVKYRKVITINTEKMVRPAIVAIKILELSASLAIENGLPKKERTKWMNSK
jgi:hypothetical protein